MTNAAQHLIVAFATPCLVDTCDIGLDLVKSLSRFRLEVPGGSLTLVIGAFPVDGMIGLEHTRLNTRQIFVRFFFFFSSRVHSFDVQQHALPKVTVDIKL